MTIADHGPGLDDDDKAAAFQRFWRADTSGPGTGLGLAIAREIVSRSGGTISLSDNSPTGLVVTVALPLVHPSTPAALGRRVARRDRPAEPE